MKFTSFRNLLAENFKKMCKDAKLLYEVACDKDEMYNLYLDSFPYGTNPIFRHRREFDCSSCHHFIKVIGNVVAIDKDNQVRTIWGFDAQDKGMFSPVAEAMDAYIKSKPIKDVWYHYENSVGVLENHAKEVVLGATKIVVYNHFRVDLPNQFVISKDRIPETIGAKRDARNVLKRSLDEITDEALETVLEWINQNVLYRGAENKATIEKFIQLKNKYSHVTQANREVFCWRIFADVPESVAKVKNSSIGTLLMDLSEGMDEEKALKRYEEITAPSNYKRPKAVFTKKMLEDAQKTVVDLGYMESLGRRYANLDDISARNILFCDRGVAKRIQDGDVFSQMMSETTSKKQNFRGATDISAEDFIRTIIPTATAMEVYLDGKFETNMVSLVAPMVKEAPSMFKWNNPFSWAYSGNVTDSLLKERVKNAGGSVTGELRFSIQWNDIGDGKDNSDLDAHCVTPDREIYFGNMRACGGVLDVDIREPLSDSRAKNGIAVENITFATRSGMRNGKYHFAVHNYANRGNKHGFRAEIEFDGKIYQFNYDKPMKNNELVEVAIVTLKNGEFTIEEQIASNMSSKDVWGLKTNNFIPVSVVCFSPNYWDEQHGIGSKHLFFMLKDCENPENPNGFFNEFLKSDLDKHKRVFEALGTKMSVVSEGAENQISGVGFCMTKRAEVVVKVDGKTFNVKF